jgi:uncharacterized membrane protein
MTICGILGGGEIILILAGLAILVFPVVRMISAQKKNSAYTERLDQLERLERMYRDGSLSEREFNRQKRKILGKEVF